MRRATVEQIGLFEDGFYPAYYEETDYCYRVRKAGHQIGFVPLATVQHLFSSREWLIDPVGHWTMLARSRYRFAVKHLLGDEIADFLQAEETANQTESAFAQVAGCTIGARQTINALPQIGERIEQDLKQRFDLQTQQVWQSGFRQIQKSALQRAIALSDQQGNQLLRSQDVLLTQLYFQPQFRPPLAESATVR